MARKNPIQLTLLSKESQTIDGKTYYIYHYSYVGRGGITRYKTVKRSYKLTKTNSSDDSDISEP